MSDLDARRRITGSDDLGTTLFVEAGAGTGKTTALVGRIVSLVATGAAELPEIAAITFTEAAAGELRERIRLALERVVADPGDWREDGLVRCGAALDVIDEAPLQTLHGFANRLLAAHAVEADLPPGFEVLDATAMGIELDRRWAAFVTGLVQDADLAPTLRLALRLGLTTEHLRLVAEELHRSWDLLVTARPTPAHPEAIDAEPVLAALRAAIACRDGCLSDTDRLCVHLTGTIPRRVRAIESASGVEDLARALFEPLPRVGTVGNKRFWSAPIEEPRRLIAEAEEARHAVLAQVRQALLARLLGALRTFVLDSVEERRASGVLEYHDLLVRARDLLRDRPDVRRAVQARHTHVLVDEFQDTDPLQVELATLLALPAGVEVPGAWDEQDGVPGRLFFVGDPKQSIYRFRRADIELYAKVRGHLGDDLLGLDSNWRSRPGILDFVNGTFGPWFESQAALGQAPWAALVVGLAGSEPPPAGPDGTVAVLGGAVEGSAEVAREAGAVDAVAAIALAKAQGWSVRDPRSGAWRSPRFDDVAVLLPTRAALPAMERSFEAAGIPFRVESRSLVWATQEVRDLLNVLRAVDDPADDVAVVAALLSTAYACAHDELWAWRRAGGSWDPTDHRPASIPADDPVARAMSSLASFVDRRHRSSPSGLIEEIVRERRLLEAAFARPRQREAWNRTRFVLEQARAWAAGGGSTLRGFVDWAGRQADEDAMALESVVPEPDDDAVRVMTIHAAKGLEFPIVVIGGLGVARMVTDQARVLWSSDGTPEVKCGRAELGWRTAGWDELEALDDAMAQHEQVRLLYVACTRARDHLVVCTHHGQQRGEATAAARLTEWCAGVTIDASSVAELAALRPTPAAAAVAAVIPAPPDPAEVAHELAAAEAHRRAAIERAARPAAVAATAVVDLPDPAAPSVPELGAAHGPAPEPEGGEATDAEGGPPPRRPGAGTAIGSAVHAVLEHAPLDPAWTGLEAAARASAAEHGCADLVDVVVVAVRAGLGSTAAATAAAVGEGRRWREVFVATEVGGTVVEGFIDLLVRTDDGLVVVDWKSDAIAGERALDEKADRYGLQLATYAIALEQVTGLPVVRTVLVFCGGGGPAREVERTGAALLRDKAAVGRRLGIGSASQGR